MENARIAELLNDFYKATGVEVSLLNADFHALVACRTSGENFCSLIHRSPRALDVCKASDIERLGEARSSRKASMYVCPFGVTEAILPVIRDDKIVAYLIASIGACGENALSAQQIDALTDGQLGEQRVSEALLSAEPISTDKARACFNLLLALAQYLADVISGLDDDSIGDLIKRYVKQNLSNKITLSDIAYSLHCSTVTLTEHFKAEFGMTIMQYVTEKRMQSAKRLLATTDEPIRELALRLGYPDVEYFSRTFKRYFGSPPGAWRKNNAASTRPSDT